MPHSFIAYIDESGDDGINPDKFKTAHRNGSTHWLTISALIIRAQNDHQAVINRDKILDANPRPPKKREIHFRNLKEDQKLFACRVISEMPVRAISVMSNKLTIPQHPRANLFSEKNTLYQYVTKYLIERISQCCNSLRPRTPEGDGTVKIIFSKRGGMVYEDFKAYLWHIKEGKGIHPESNYINWNVVDIDSIEAIDHSRRAGLQLVDCVASAFSAAVELNRFGMTVPAYANELKRIVYKKNGTAIGHGLKYIPNLAQMDLTEDQRSFLTDF